MKKIIIILTIFLTDRLSKIYILNLQSEGTDIDFYILPFLNVYLVWNTGIGFGLISLESGIYYHILSFIIFLVNLLLVYLLVKSKGAYSYLIAMSFIKTLYNL